MEDNKLLSFHHPVCQHLRTKALYIPGGSLKNLVEANPSSYYWCNRTMTVVGPDDDFVSPNGCKKSRHCFVGVGGRILAEVERTGNKVLS
mgnify:CR=1 FL=1